MTKSQVRKLKSHYLSRWAMMRLNQKQDQKVLLITDQFVLKNIIGDSTLCLDCLGDMYRDIIVNLSTSMDGKKYNNLVLINNIEFKYKTLDQIANYIDELASKVLLPNGRIILSFAHQFLIYNRVDIAIDTLLDLWTQRLKNFKLHRMLNLRSKSQPGYGDYFFCLDYK